MSAVSINNCVQVPELDAIIAAVGGGGLVSGIAVAAKVNPTISDVLSCQ